MKLNNRLIAIVTWSLMFGSLLLPIASHADTEPEAGKGVIRINLFDKNSDPILGEWYLFEGTEAKGIPLRSGVSSETLLVEPGIYFLEVRKQWNGYPFALEHSPNPQLVNVGETATFNVQYFKHQEDMLAALLPFSTTDTDPADAVSADAVSADEEVTAVTDEAETAIDVVEEAVNQVTEAVSFNAVVSADSNFKLATTGPSVGFIALIAMASGLMAGKRRKED
jgi:hypothetical protein